MIPEDVLTSITDALSRVLLVAGHPEKEIPEYVAILQTAVIQLASTYLIMEMPNTDRLKMLTSLQHATDPKNGLTIIFSYKHEEERLYKAFEDGIRDVIYQYFQKILPTLSDIQRNQIRQVMTNLPHTHTTL